MIDSTATRMTRTALALAGAGVLAAGLGLAAGGQALGAPAPARTAAHAPVRMDDLLHPADVAGAFGVRGDVTSRVGSDGDSALSACTGETSMRDVVGPDAHLFHGVFRGRAPGAGLLVLQQAADQATTARATMTYRSIVGQLRACQHEPAGHWRYGAAHVVSTGAGTATWMATTDGDGTADGGVVIARSGRHLSVVEAMGSGAGRQVGRLAAGTLRELG